MKKHIMSLVVTAAAVFCLANYCMAELVTPDEARQIANNWVTLIIGNTGSWGGHDRAEISQVEDFRDNDRLLGYYCRVNPSGYVVVSLIKGLAPVKTYSGSSELDLDADDGPAGLIKFQMSRIQIEIEKQLGSPVSATIVEIEKLMAFKYSPMLKKLNLSADKFRQDLLNTLDKGNYIEGDSLLSSNWHQTDPYFRMCPPASGGCAETNCTVGCVALAAAQIMRYWSWPPGRVWGLMPDEVDSTSSQLEIDAVAELCASIGSAVGMNYCSDGCESSVPTAYMEGVYEGWHFDDCVVPQRIGYPAEYWWGGPGMVKDQLSVNRPIQYRIMGHSIVLDGWREWFYGSYYPEYHMNYGWADDANAWYAMDGLLQVVDTANWTHEYMVIGIAPDPSLEGTVSGPVLTLPFPYRYIDRDCAGSYAAFQAGQLIQFLPGVTLHCTEGTVRFDGTAGAHSVLYTPEPNRGIEIQKGAMVMHPGCGIRFRQERP